MDLARHQRALLARARELLSELSAAMLAASGAADMLPDLASFVTRLYRLDRRGTRDTALGAYHCVCGICVCV